MRSLLLAVGASMAILAITTGCDQDSEPSSEAKAPSTASAGAGTPQPTVGPKDERVAVPPAPSGATSSAETKPDPGDANDHSNPQHDSRNKTSGD
jgi:hypothetical protein